MPYFLSRKNGYIALLTTIVLSSVFVLLFVGMYIAGIASLERVTEREYSYKTESLANICAEEALNTIRANPTDNISNIRVRNEGDCDIENVSWEGENVVSFESVGAFPDYEKRIRVTAIIEEDEGERRVKVSEWSPI